MFLKVEFEILVGCRKNHVAKKFGFEASGSGIRGTVSVRGRCGHGW